VAPHLSLPADTALGYNLRLTDEMLRARLQERLTPSGVRLAQWQYLRVLWERDGISQQELGQRVSRLGPNTGTALGILERNGFVRRERSRRDRRVVRVYLTQKARAKQDEMIRAAVEAIDAATAGLDESDLVVLMRILRKMQQNLTRM